jgi:hypothetical protein
MADEEYTGRVVVRTVNRGSKSEHRAAFLETPGGLLPLRRPSGPPFHDPVLLRLARSTVRCRGQAQNGKLLLSAWRKIKRGAAP